MGVTREQQIDAMVDRLDTRDVLAQDEAWAALRPLGYGIVPFLLRAHDRFRTWQGRTAGVYYSTRYARMSEAALPLGVKALGDRSYMVRYRACGLLAYSLREEALEPLSAALADPKPMVAAAAQAARNAILAGNHNLFADQRLTGKVNWSVNPGDTLLVGSPPPLPSMDLRHRLGIVPVLD